MADPRFFKVGPALTLAEVARETGAILTPDSATDKLVTGVAPLSLAGEADVSFQSRAAMRQAFERSAAGAVFVTPALAGASGATASRRNLLVVDDPQGAYATLARRLFPEPAATPTISAQAAISPDAQLGVAVTVGPMAVIGAHAEIGAGSVIGAGAIIGDGVVIGPGARIGAQACISHALIGARVTILPGARIGQPGFGYHPGPTGLTPIPQLGRVIIGNDVDIGANTTIDRGAGDDTVIGDGTKIDNQVQIGHNCRIGMHCIIVGQVGLSGSVTLGNGVQLGGQVGVADHLHIGDGARVMAKAGVMRDIPAGAVQGGAPAMDYRGFMRGAAMLNRMAQGSRTRED